ncbi:hypothetical protein [Kitasatospora sp. CB01950]|uniref:hypothetical protein n=1 Tax=Kitasatospora sp. CB01950 TaxID=1703930 RepID=UPI0013016D4E|nr:hypothetical protein [Kitasatospora sp. CB01950]
MVEQVRDVVRPAAAAGVVVAQVPGRRGPAAALVASLLGTVLAPLALARGC